MTDQTAQGSTADYCSRWPGEPHAMVISVRANALVSVSRCSLCGWIDFDDIREQAEALIAEGRRQATESSTREWAVSWPETLVPYAADDEDDARHFASLRDDRTVVSRLVGPWEPAEQTEAASEPQPRDVKPDRYMMATTAIHKLGDISRETPSLAVIYGETDADWIGQWVAGAGLVNARFPKATTRELTDDEKAHYRTKVVQIGSHGPVERIRIDGPEPASGGVVEPSPLTAEEAEPAHESFTEARCIIGDPHGRHTWSHLDRHCNGHVCPGEPYRRQHDPGALMEEPDRVSLDDLTDRALFGLGDLTWPAEQGEGGAR